MDDFRQVLAQLRQSWFLCRFAQTVVKCRIGRSRVNSMAQLALQLKEPRDEAIEALARSPAVVPQGEVVCGWVFFKSKRIRV